MSKARTAGQFAKFAIIGMTNTVVSLAVYYLCLLAGAHYIAANTAGFIAGTLNSYFWNNRFVFTKKTGVMPQLKSLSKVFVIYGLTFLMNTFLLFVLVDWLGISSFVAPLINAAILLPVSFVLNKVWAFR